MLRFVNLHLDGLSQQLTGPCCNFHQRVIVATHCITNELGNELLVDVILDLRSHCLCKISEEPNGLVKNVGITIGVIGNNLQELHKRWHVGNKVSEQVAVPKALDNTNVCFQNSFPQQIQVFDKIVIVLWNKGGRCLHKHKNRKLQIRLVSSTNRHCNVTKARQNRWFHRSMDSAILQVIYQRVHDSITEWLHICFDVSTDVTNCSYRNDTNLVSLEISESSN
mmetsp:Transcript_474/g.1035  ORF Transcript_474/g.1035 Transcript_474/m.1035 type:complete len:223 (+) Transcript_474:424-1092(+)